MEPLSIPVQPSDEVLLADLAVMSYAQVAQKHGVSRGKIWSVACRHNARKHEARILEKKAETKARQEEFLKSVINAMAPPMDVLDFMDSLPRNSADLICTSPPYNVGKGYGGGNGDARDHFYYLGWLLQCLSEMNRVLRPGGVLFLQVGSTRSPDGESLYPLDTLLFGHLVSMGLTPQNRIVWPIAHGLTPKRRLAARHETVLVFSKGPVKTFNPTPARTQTKQPGKRSFKGPNKGKISSHPLGSFPTDVWSDIGQCKHNSADKREGGDHPAQFPQKLARRAILLYTLPGDLVLDPYMGSGTTAVECLRTGRDFVGADLFYEDTRRTRLAKIAPDLVSELPGISDESIAVWQAEAKIVRQFAGEATEQGLLDLAA